MSNNEWIARLPVNKAYQKEEKEMNNNFMKETAYTKDAAPANRVDNLGNEMECLFASIRELEYFVDAKLFGNPQNESATISASGERYRSTIDALIEVPEDLRRIRERINEIGTRLTDLL